MPKVISLPTWVKRGLSNVSLEMPAPPGPEKGRPRRHCSDFFFYSGAKYRVLLATWEDEGKVRKGIDLPGSKLESVQLAVWQESQHLAIKRQTLVSFWPTEPSVTQLTMKNWRLK